MVEMSSSRGIHALNEVDTLSAKMNLLMKKVEEDSKKEQEAIQPYTTARAVKTDPWCDVCGGEDHSGNNCPKTNEEVSFISSNNNNNNGYRPQQQLQGWNSCPIYQNQGNSYNNNFNNSYGNQPSLRDLVLGQSKIENDG